MGVHIFLKPWRMTCADSAVQNQLGRGSQETLLKHLSGGLCCVRWVGLDPLRQLSVPVIERSLSAPYPSSPNNGEVSSLAQILGLIGLRE